MLCFASPSFSLFRSFEIGDEREMAKSSADDGELRRACDAAIEDPKQKIVMALRVAKSHGILGKPSSKLGRMAKPRVLALSSYLPLPKSLSSIRNSTIYTVLKL